MAALKAYWDAPDDEDHIPSIQAAFDADVPQIVKAEVERALASFSEPGVQSVVTDLAAKYVRERFGEEPGTPAPPERCKCWDSTPERTECPKHPWHPERREPILPRTDSIYDLGEPLAVRLAKLERFCTALARIYEVANPGDSRVTNVRAAAREYLRP